MPPEIVHIDRSCIRTKKCKWTRGQKGAVTSIEGPKGVGVGGRSRRKAQKEKYGRGSDWVTDHDEINLKRVLRAKNIISGHLEIDR